MKLGDDKKDEDHSDEDFGDDVKERPESEMNHMQEGDYMIHVFVEYLKNIKMDGEDVVDPVIEVECLGQKKYTSTKAKIDCNTLVTWNEHLFFELRGLTKGDLETAKITYKLLDKGFLKSNQLGLYEFDVSSIYSSNKEHACLHSWISMSNPESEDYSEVTANIKSSVAVAGPNDKQIPIEEDPDLDFSNIMQQPQVKNKFIQLTFHFFRAEKIISMDSSLVGKGKSDVYIQLDNKGIKKKSSVQVCKHGDFCIWDEEFLVPL